MQSLQYEETGKLFLPDYDYETLQKKGFLGAGISRLSLPINEQYRAFVQSKGYGGRHLASGTFILYEEKVCNNYCYVYLYRLS